MEQMRVWGFPNTTAPEYFAEWFSAMSRRRLVPGNRMTAFMAIIACGTFFETEDDSWSFEMPTVKDCVKAWKEVRKNFKKAEYVISAVDKDHTLRSIPVWA